jgi:hypothetical protein
MFGGFLIEPPLHQNIENEPLLVECFVLAMVRTTSSRYHFSPRPVGSSKNAIGEFAAKLPAPLLDRLIGDGDATSRQHASTARVAIAGIKQVLGVAIQHRYPTIPGPPSRRLLKLTMPAKTSRR